GFGVATMETVCVLCGKQFDNDMTKFGGKVFGVKFALGVATGVTMEFQFGTKWSYYCHYVVDIFGAPLAIEGLMAFFLESTFVGLVFFGWQLLSNVQHTCFPLLVPLGPIPSAWCILVPNVLTQHQYAAASNFEPRHME
ncbi:cytochrome ubiquinol oxidase subunit I, partial [Salmonella enterica]|uniref:cytochrome ubiquinol oxidase subunit I n=1 Tax=Salmonella enterica TaxID=28901 RepID=UPI00398C5682